MRRDLPQRLPALPLLVAASLGLLLSGCGIGSWFDSDKPPPLPGKRVSVLQLERKIEPDPSLQGRPVVLPPPARNQDWPQPGGAADHAMGNLSLGESPREVWSADIGSGSNRTLRLLARPIVAGGKLFAMDAESEVSAFDAASGQRLWRIDLRPENATGDPLRGGISFADGKLFAGTGDAEVMAIDPANGTVLWRKKLPAPVRGAPTALAGRVFVVTIDNQTLAFSASDGGPLWNHNGILETAGLLGSVSPAADAAVVVVPYSSGELFALRVENGRAAWSDNLVAIRRAGAMSGMADIRGLPVIDRGLVLAVGHSGRMVAIDERSGGRVWEQEIGGVDQPWSVGDIIFVLSNESEVIAIERTTGRIRWVSSLDRYVDPEDRTEAIVWNGPIVAGGRLWLTSSTEKLVALSANTGEILSRTELRGPAMLSPIVADATLYVLTDNGRLTAFR